MSPALLNLGWSVEHGAAEYVPACELCRVRRVASAGEVCAHCDHVRELDRRAAKWRGGSAAALARVACMEAPGLPGFGLAPLVWCSWCLKFRERAAVMHHRFKGRIVWRVDPRPLPHDVSLSACCARCLRRAIGSALRDQVELGRSHTFVSAAVCRLLTREVVVIDLDARRVF